MQALALEPVSTIELTYRERKEWAQNAIRAILQDNEDNQKNTAYQEVVRTHLHELAFSKITDDLKKLIRWYCKN